MLIKFIDKNGNRAMLETSVDSNRMSRVEKNWDFYFEKKTEEPKPIKKKAEKVEEIVEEKEPISEPKQVEYDEVDMKNFLKEKKVRWFWLLKWESLKKKAIEYGFNI